MRALDIFASRIHIGSDFDLKCFSSWPIRMYVMPVLWWRSCCRDHKTKQESYWLLWSFERERESVRASILHASKFGLRLKLSRLKATEYDDQSIVSLLSRMSALWDVFMWWKMNHWYQWVVLTVPVQERADKRLCVWEKLIVPGNVNIYVCIQIKIRLERQRLILGHVLCSW